MADDLTGRTSLVTGATAGLGREIALDLARSGARVVVHGRSREDAESVVEEISHSGGQARAVLGDLADPAAPHTIVQEVSTAWGPIDLLVNNAADQTLTPLAQPANEAWPALLQVNVIAAVELMREVCAAAPRLDDVAIVTIASVEGLAPFPRHAAYAASKAALLSATASAAREWAPARVNAVAPGLIERAGLAEAWPQGHAWWAGVTPLARPVTTREVAAAVRFLLSSSASGITGVTLPVDAGWSTASRTPWGGAGVSSME